VVLGGMWLGSFTCGLPAFDLELFCQKMAEFKATWVHIVPPVATLLSQSDIPLKYDLSNLRTIVVAAAPMKVGHLFGGCGVGKRYMLTVVNPETVAGKTETAVWTRHESAARLWPLRVLADRHDST